MPERSLRQFKLPVGLAPVDDLRVEIDGYMAVLLGHQEQLFLLQVKDIMD